MITRTEIYKFMVQESPYPFICDESGFALFMPDFERIPTPCLRATLPGPDRNSPLVSGMYLGPTFEVYGHKFRVFVKRDRDGGFYATFTHVDTGYCVEAGTDIEKIDHVGYCVARALHKLHVVGEARATAAFTKAMLKTSLKSA